MAPESHIRNTIKNAAIFATGTILEKAAGFLLLPLYAHLLGSEGYGIIGMIDVAVSALGIAVSYGIGSALYRFYFTRKTEESRNILVSTANFTQCMLSFAVSLPAMALSGPIAHITIGTEAPSIYVLLAVIAFMFDSTSAIGQSYLLIKQRSIFISILSFMRFALGISFNIYLILILRLGVMGFLYSQLIIAAILALFYNAYVIFETGIHFKIEEVKEIVKYSLPLLPGYVAMFIRSNADRIILRTYFGLAELGVYAMVTKFSLLIGLLSHEPFMKTWAPKRMEICDSEEGPQTISKVFTLHLTLMLFIGLILSLEIPTIIEVIAPSEFWIAGAVAFFAVMARIAFSSYYHHTFGLLYGKKTFKLSLIQIISATISVPLYLIFIHSYGLLGAFVSAFIVYMIQCVITYIFAKPYYYIPFEWKNIFILSISSIVLFILIQSMSLQHTDLSNVLEIYISPGIKTFLNIIHLDHFKNGKLVMIIDKKLYIIVEGIIKGILALSYIFVALFLGIIKKEHLKSAFKRLIPRNIVNMKSKTI